MRWSAEMGMDKVAFIADEEGVSGGLGLEVEVKIVGDGDCCR